MFFNVISDSDLSNFILDPIAEDDLATTELYCIMPIGIQTIEIVINTNAITTFLNGLLIAVVLTL